MATKRKKKSKTSRKGRSLEKLVESLERVLSGKEGVSIESPKFLPDRVTKDQREHDVVITTRTAHHELTLAIECRDRSRKVNVNDVESFASKCQDTQVNKGVIVSAKGFTRAAQQKATNSSIACLSLREVSSFDWLVAPGVSVRSAVIRSLKWNLIAEPRPPTMPIAYTLIDATGQEMSLEALAAAAKSKLNSFLHRGTNLGIQRIILNFSNPGITLRDNDTGIVYAVPTAQAGIEYEVIEELVPFKLVTYENSETGATITNAAVAEVRAGSVPGRIMIVHEGAEGARIVFLPEKQKTGGS